MTPLQLSNTLHKWYTTSIWYFARKLEACTSTVQNRNSEITENIYIVKQSVWKTLNMVRIGAVFVTGLITWGLLWPCDWFNYLRAVVTCDWFNYLRAAVTLWLCKSTKHTRFISIQNRSSWTWYNLNSKLNK